MHNVVKFDSQEFTIKADQIRPLIVHSSQLKPGMNYLSEYLTNFDYSFL